MPTQTITNNPPRSETPVFGHTIKVGGKVTGGGGNEAITEHGHCWNTTGTPTTADSKTTLGASGGGTFTSPLTGLVTDTLYYVRAYAINPSGTSYGNEVTFTTFVPKVFYFH